MSKPNDFLSRLKSKQSAQLRYVREFTLQWCADAAIIAANKVFHRRGKILEEFMHEFSNMAHLIAEMTQEDAKGDKTLEYTKAKTDEWLKELLGDAFQPWDERYDFLTK